MRNKILPASEAKLRIHGNGFLQAETACGNKFHVWDTRLPQQRVRTFKHNHNHGFKSTLLLGDLTWMEFELIPDVHPGSPVYHFIRHQCIPRKGKDTRLEPVSGASVGITLPREFFLKQGSTYVWPLDMTLYHEVNPAWSDKPQMVDRYSNPPKWERPEYQQVITFVERREYCDEIPTVLVLRGVQPDNGFDRYAFEDLAIQVYEDAMENI